MLNIVKKFPFFPGMWYRGVHRDNHVCVDCRYSSRIGGTCPFCGEQTAYIGDKWRIPKKNDKKGWEKIKSLWVYKTFKKDKNESSDCM